MTGHADVFERRSDLVRLLTVADAERIVTVADHLAMTWGSRSRFFDPIWNTAKNRVDPRAIREPKTAQEL